MHKKELLEKALCCIRCGTCRGVTQDTAPDTSFATQCPCGMTFYGAYEPAGLIYIARGIAQGVLKWNTDIAKVLYACTLCGYCDDVCRRGIRCTPAIAIIEELRRIVPHKFKPKHLKNAAAAFKLSKIHKLEMLKRYDIRDVTDGLKADILFFPDISLLTDTPKLKEIGYILQKSGLPIGCFYSPLLPPVSADLLNGGRQRELQTWIGEIDAKLRAYNIKKVIVYNPQCLSVLKRFSRSNVEFLSIIGFYAAMLKNNKARKIKLPTVTYQDPCHLGRYAKEYAAPREVISALGLNLKDMWRAGDNALCCGAGGGVLTGNPGLAGTYAAHRWKEACATNARVMITACPNCYSALNNSRPVGFKVIDISTLVAAAYGYGAKESLR